MRCFDDVFEKNIDVDVFDDVLQNAKHRANDASNDVNRPPLLERDMELATTMRKSSKPPHSRLLLLLPFRAFVPPFRALLSLTISDRLSSFILRV